MPAFELGKVLMSSCIFLVSQAVFRVKHEGRGQEVKINTYSCNVLNHKTLA